MQYIFLLICLLAEIKSNLATDFQRTISARQLLLRKIALQNKPQHCNISTVIRITSHYGRTGNNWIIIANGLWLSTLVGGSLELQFWMHDRVFKYFDLHVFNQSFCVTKSRLLDDSKIIWMMGIDAYAVDRIYRNEDLIKYLPILNEETFRKVSFLYTRFYASLWSSPKQIISQLGKEFIQWYLNNSLNYISLHQRSFEGQCRKNFCVSIHTSYFSPKEVPLHENEWLQIQRWEQQQSNTFRNCTGVLPPYPLCNLNAMEVEHMLALQRRTANDSLIHLGTDMPTNTNVLVESLRVKIPKVLYTSTSVTVHDDELMHLDLYLFIHSSLFLQHPLSTFSSVACIVRETLNIPTVPLLYYVYNNRSIPERLLPGWFASCSTVHEMIHYVGGHSAFLAVAASNHKV